MVLQDIGRVLRNLITIGVVSTWAISAAAAYLLLDFNLALSVLVGAMLVVSGPTVVGPLLRHVRPIERLRSTLQWEGILIDPIGVMVAVLAFAVILAGEMQHATSAVITVLVIAAFAVANYLHDETGLFGFLHSRVQHDLARARLFGLDRPPAVSSRRLCLPSLPCS